MTCYLPGSSPTRHFDRRENPGDEVETGKCTHALKLLKGKDVKVVASEPLQSMCEQFRLMVLDTKIIQWPAELK